MVSTKQKRWRAAILTVGGGSILFSIVYPGLARHLLKSDYQNAVPQRDVATVAMLVPGHDEISGAEYPSKALVRFHGQLLKAQAVTDYAGLSLNQSAQIIYRVGKSGRIYIDNVAPLPAARTAAKK